MRSSRAFSRSCSMDTGAVLRVAALIAGPFLNGRSLGRARRPLIVLNRAYRCHADRPPQVGCAKLLLWRTGVRQFRAVALDNSRLILSVMCRRAVQFVLQV